MEVLREEYVLVQAWKKTASYIRYHNWFSDTLALDRAAASLPTFIDELREHLQSPESWQNDPLRMVPAPKSQNWEIREGSWGPVQKGATSARLRPLAHVSLSDQVLATALMLCLADRVETLQGDPRIPPRDLVSRRMVTSYGNRLFCDAVGNQLRHRWGSSKLYRAYYQDYRTFLSRPEVAAESIPTVERRAYVVQADLRQFYDRVTPSLLATAMGKLERATDDPAFYSLATSVFDWSWHSKDDGDVRIYAEQAGLLDFTRVALPQGLVASGFFANIVLLDFDQALRAAIGTEIVPGILLADACRYVDDLRILVTAVSDRSMDDLGSFVSEWLGQALEHNAAGLELSPKKTSVAALGGDDRPLVRLGSRMNRIQSAVSGGFDALGGEEILDAIQGLVRAQEALNVGDDSGWRLSPVPDVRDVTVTRFSAARYRTTFRSIRPLLEEDHPEGAFEVGLVDDLPGARLRVGRTRRELDEDARAFALGLIQRWVSDPSNVRLLRIGLDLWPDAGLLQEVLSLLRPFTEKGGRRKAPRRVAWYCLAEVLRAGATETGLVADGESLPSDIDLDSYRQLLGQEAARLVALPGPTIPWYLRQQALLFLAAHDPAAAPVTRTGTVSETRHYRELIRFLRGEGGRLGAEFATLAVVARRAFVNRERAIELTRPGLTRSRERQLAQKDPSFLLELLDDRSGSILSFVDLPARVREDLCRSPGRPDGEYETLANAVLNAHPEGRLRNEISLLRFALTFLGEWEQLESVPAAITPGQIRLELRGDHTLADVNGLSIVGSRADPTGSLYEPPPWCEMGERWRFQLGFLLRFILSGQPDFTRPVRRPSWRETESCYRAAESHWYQRLYGLYNGQPAFGDDWLPITDWVEGFLLALLRWPGCRALIEYNWVEHGIQAAQAQIAKRITFLEHRYGTHTRTLMLPLPVGRPTPTNTTRPLRACVVQTAFPAAVEPSDLKFDDPTTRRRHRNHLAAALAAVRRMLAFRATHKGNDGQLDWLILPELAVHPNDVWTHIVPFARAHRAIVLTGLTYEELVPGQPLVNSALWVIPEWSSASGLQIRTRRQGKANLAPSEQELNTSGPQVLQGFQRGQWLIGYPWTSAVDTRPVWLTAAVCYDATDLGLAADLRGMSDVLAIPAFNKDVKTFDQMALALHYHMFQLVLVANNGQYGGSNAYWPRSDIHVRQIFHVHGQPQASVAFLEIDNMESFLKRKDASAASSGDWKHPPAGIVPSSPGGPF